MRVLLLVLLGTASTAFAQLPSTVVKCRGFQTELELRQDLLRYDKERFVRGELEETLVEWGLLTDENFIVRSLTVTMLPEDCVFNPRDKAAFGCNHERAQVSFTSHDGAELALDLGFGINSRRIMTVFRDHEFYKTDVVLTHGDDQVVAFSDDFSVCLTN